jgi:hypothetical protein
MTTGMVLGGILFFMLVMLAARLNRDARARRGEATGADGSVAMYGDGGGGDSGCDSGGGGDCGGGDGGGGGGD